MKLLKSIFNTLNKILSLFFRPLSYVFPKSNIILLGTYSRHKYGENTKYLYEFLSRKDDLSVYWITDSKPIIEYLKNKNHKYISLRSPLTALWILLRTKVVIDSGTGFFNPLGILTTKKVTKITTSHGNGPKVTISRFHPPNNHVIAIEQIVNLYRFDYVNYPSEYSANHIGKKIHLLPNHKIISLGYPRCDKYFDQTYVSKVYNEKKISKSLTSSVNSKSKIFLYTPTWRPYEYVFPLEQMPNIDFNIFDAWLKDKDAFLFFSIHTAHLPKNIPKNLKRIIYIDPNQHPFFDTNQFMLEVDVLLNDYSTTSTDFALLNRPQLFYMPDYDFYENESGFAENYRKLLPGGEVHSYSDLTEQLDFIYSDPKVYLQKFEDKRKELVDKYYDPKIGNSSELFYNHIKSVIN